MSKDKMKALKKKVKISEHRIYGKKKKKKNLKAFYSLHGISLRL